MNLITVNDEKFISMVNTTSDLGDLLRSYTSGRQQSSAENSPLPKTCTNYQWQSQTRTLQISGQRDPCSSNYTNEIGQSDGRVNKANGKLRIYFDPQAFNSALLREYY